MEKRGILDTIRRMSEANGGKAPGSQLFEAETGLGKHGWYPVYWLRWSDALREAGCQPNTFNTRSDETLLIMKYIDLARELGHFPIEGDLLLKRKADKTFPNRDAFNTLGNKSHRARKVLEHCNSHKGFEDVAALCNKVLEHKTPKADDVTNESSRSGWVYLIKHGSRREYKVGFTWNLLRREGVIAFELPQEAIRIHTIETDDPSGIEEYWKKRFEPKKLRVGKNEWFALTPADIRAFKRWKKIY